VARLAQQIERQLRTRLGDHVGDDQVLLLLVRQTARQGALGEALADELLVGDARDRRLARKQWTAAVEGFRRGVAVLEGFSRNGHDGHQDLEVYLRERYTNPAGDGHAPAAEREVPR
jgi:hypothetical protein